MSRRTIAVVAGAVALLSFLFHASYGFDGIALFDEGLLVDGAVRLLHGERFGRDAFAPYGPASYWVVAPLLQAFGSTMGVLRATTIVVQSLCDAGLFVVAATGATPLGALLATGLLLVAHGSLHKSFLVLSALLVLFAARSLARRVDGRGAFLAGALCGVAFLFRHDVGAFGGVALLLGLFVEAAPMRATGSRRVVALAAGFLVPVVPAAIVLLALGLDPHSWWDHEWQRIAVQERIRVAFPWPQGPDGWKWGRLVLSSSLIAAPCILLIWGGSALVRRVRGRALEADSFRVAAALFGLLLLNQARLIPSVNHFFQAMAPIALALGDGLARRGRGAATTVAGHAVLALLLALLVIWCAGMPEGTYSGTFTQRTAGAIPLDLPTGGVNVSADDAATLVRLIGEVERRVAPDGFLLTSPSCPLVGFLARRRLAVPYAEPAYFFGGPRFEQEVIDAYERRQPALFVHDPRPASTFTLERDAPLVAHYLATHYRPIGRVDRFTLFERMR